MARLDNHHTDSKEIKRSNMQATTFLKVLEDLERVLATRREFLLGPWLEAAKVRWRHEYQFLD